MDVASELGSLGHLDSTEKHLMNLGDGPKAIVALNEAGVLGPVTVQRVSATRTKLAGQSGNIVSSTWLGP